MVYICGGELYHYGVMGMHWGIRRYQPYPAGHTGGKEVGQAARAKKKKYVYPSADINSMSNDQLRRKVNRMNLEKRYADMSTQKYVAERKAQKAAGTSSNKLSKFGKDKIVVAAKTANKALDKVGYDGKKIDVKKLTSDDGRNAKAIAGGVQSVGKTVKGVNDLTKSAQRINRVDYRNEKMYEATKMSYKELNDKVNRMDMEYRYNELKDSAYTTKGKQALEELWPILMSIGAIGFGAYGTANGIKAAKGLIK